MEIKFALQSSLTTKIDDPENYTFLQVKPVNETLINFNFVLKNENDEWEQVS